MKANAKAKVTFDDEKWKQISPLAMDFIQRILEVDPAKRMSASEALQHKWLN